MTLDQLKGFCAIVEERSFSRAARRRYVTQPAISMQIKALEKEIGEPLLDRGGRQVVPTDAGHLLYEHAKGIFESVDMARRALEERRGMAGGRLTVACSDTLSTYLVAPILPRYIRDCPRVEITILNKTSPEIVRLVLDREADLGLATLPVGRPGLAVEPLVEYRDAAVCSRSQHL